MSIRRIHIRASIALTLLSFTALGGGQAYAEDLDTCIDASERALVLRKEEKLIEARALMSSCAAEACPAAVREVCQQRLTRILPTIPSIVFAAKDGSGRDLSAVKVTVDGTLSAEQLIGEPLVLDPGAHEFTFEVQGEAPVVRHFVLRQGEQARREEIVIGVAPPPQMPVVRALPTIAAPIRSTPLGMGRTLGIVSGSVGVAGLVVGAIAGELAIERVSASHASCPFDGTMDRCSNAGVSDMNEAKTFARISDVTFGVGALGVVTGVVLWVWRPHRERPSASEGAAWSDPHSWFWDVASTPHATEGFVGHRF